MYINILPIGFYGEKQMKELTKIEQYNLLKKVKSELKNNTGGICCHLRYAIAAYIDVPFIHDNEIKDYIPCFTYSHICELTKGTIVYPTGTIHWWEKGNSVIRRYVLNLLMCELSDPQFNK